MSDNCIPASELLTVIAALRTPFPASPGEPEELRRHLRAVQQGREQAAQRLEWLLREYGVDAAEVARFLRESRGGG